MLRLVVAQQVSTSSAAAIWARVRRALNPISPAGLLALSDADLRSLGFSFAKAGYARTLASAVAHGELDLQALQSLSDQDALERLTATSGVGPWTASTYFLFCEGRKDLCPEGDVALREALRRADGAQLRPSEKAFRLRAAQWSPHRGVAAHLLWAFYRTQEGGAAPIKGGAMRLGGVAKKVQ